MEPKNVYVVLGKSVVVDCSADGHPQPRILWKKSVNNPTSSGTGSDILNLSDRDLSILDNSISENSGSTSSIHPSEYRELLSTYRRQIYTNGTLCIQEAEKSDAGFYMCQVSNSIGAGLSKVIQLVVQSPPFFATKFLSKSVSKGELALLECEAQGDPVLHIRWFKDRALILPNPFNHSNNQTSNGTFLSTVTAPLYDKRYTIKQDVISTQKVISYLQIISVQREDSTIYTCLARNNFGSDNTSVQLIVQEVPDPPQNVELVEITSRTAQFQWKSPYSGNSALIRFYIHYRLVNCSLTYSTSHIDPKIESLSGGNNNNNVGNQATYWKEINTASGNELRYLIKGCLQFIFIVN